MADERRMRAWTASISDDPDCPVVGISVSNTGHIVIAMRSGLHALQEISDEHGQNWLHTPVAIRRQLVLRVQRRGRP